MTKCFNCMAEQLFIRTKHLLILLLILLSACTDNSTTISISDRDIELNNKGVALMGRFDYQAANLVFKDLVDREPLWHEARTNLAIALLNRQQENDGQLALGQLAIVLEAQADNLRANYTTGVLQLYLGEIDVSAKHFNKALSVDPSDAYAHYYLGQCQLRSGDQSAALASYQKSIELDPYLRSAYYSASQVLRRLDRDEEASEQLKLFQRFENNPRARLAEFKYTRMGPKSLAVVLGDKPEADITPSLPDGPIFSDQRVVAQLKGTSVNMQLSTVDLNQNGSQDLFIASNTELENRVLLSTEGSNFAERITHPWKDVSDINAVAWGDVDNNGLVDAYLCRSGANQLWLQADLGSWSQIGDEANIGDGEKDCTDTTLLDADHDGDLDILIANRGAADNLLNNNRDGTFRSLANKLGSAGKNGNTQHLIATDIDADDDVDLIFINEETPHLVLINDRLWNYLPSTNHDELQNTEISSLAAVDLNADGQTELVSLNDEGEIKLWQPNNTGQWQSSKTYDSELIKENPADLVPLDLNGNGSPELAILTDGAFEIVALTNTQNADGWKSTQIAFEQYEGSKAIPVIRTTRGSSLIALANSDEGANVIEWGPGAGRFEFATLSFSGKHDAAETMRSNHSGIGTKVSLRNGSQWSITDTHKHSSLRGYSLQPISIGLGSQEKADFVAVDWSDGVYQTEMNIESGSNHFIAEEQRQLGSCPVLFAWDGQQFNFVTDILGVAAQGFLVEPGKLLPPRPWERVTFAPGKLASKDGSITFKVTEPMQENSYIDAMTLESYDLPIDWNVIVDERMGTGAPKVTGETMFYKNSLSPARAFDSAGDDVHALILKHDQQAMSPGEIDRRYIGLLQEKESLTIEFDKPINHLSVQPNALPVLVADSWLELPYSQTHFSAWQAGNQYRSVTLEARDSDNEWHTVYPEFGIPAGMQRVVSLPLRALPLGTLALRLSWNREIYWDRIRIVYAEPAPKEMQYNTASPKFASVAKSGFYKRINHSQRRAEYLYQKRKPFCDVKYATGFYTNLGEMTELVTNSDDALAIIGPGEEIHVEFEATAPPPMGLKRWYVLETRGWAKDKDMYTYQGNTVEPLPVAKPNIDSQARDALHQQYNTRFQSGR